MPTTERVTLYQAADRRPGSAAILAVLTDLAVAATAARLAGRSASRAPAGPAHPRGHRGDRRPGDPADPRLAHLRHRQRRRRPRRCGPGEPAMTTTPTTPGTPTAFAAGPVASPAVHVDAVLPRLAWTIAYARHLTRAVMTRTGITPDDRDAVETTRAYSLPTDADREGAINSLITDR
ncbi:hypothetical protein EV385_6222 [Krasilnikovia cinnamomea]|uniref:Uncharacterized protein n=1 Tax=Krasilnikovia cinnamomea TaxID=349313 RepID=A0A4Q7ZTL7_9ACTN|nr:hypothetical protein [Krasilnikovia cinnamomea]RZU54274.1 hypothetical protein EV385_6222 [Krasilnikovia cinnamomea]